MDRRCVLHRAIMFLFATLLCILVYVVVHFVSSSFQALDASSGKNNTDSAALASLLSYARNESWIPGKDPGSQDNASDVDSLRLTSSAESRDDLDDTFRPQSDQAPVQLSQTEMLKHLLEIPKHDVVPDWHVVLGTFDHYADDNWKNFLVQTEVPFVIRWFLGDSSETVTVTRSKKKRNKRKQAKKLKQESKKGKAGSDPAAEKAESYNTDSDEDYEVVLQTSDWFLTHTSKFYLKETYIEHDLDGTDSKNTFFFAASRLLVHHKDKAKWKTTIFRHFDENGMNITFLDRERHLTAHRYLRRIQDKT